MFVSSVNSHRYITFLFLAFLVSCTGFKHNEAADNLEKNKEIIHRLYDETWNKGNLNVTDECYTAKFMQHDPSSPDENWGTIDSHKQLVTHIRNAFPDLQIVIEDTIAEGDRVAIRYTVTGTHKGVFKGIPATGKTINVTGYEIVRIENDKIAELWNLSDTFTTLRQLGVLPAGE